MASLMNSIKYYKKKNTNFLQMLPKNIEEHTQLILWGQYYPYTKITDNTWKLQTNTSYGYRCKHLKTKTNLANSIQRIQQHIKGITHHDQVVCMYPRNRGCFNTQKSVCVIYYIIRIKYENPRDHLKYADKSFDKIQHYFMTEALHELGTEGNILN